MQKLRLAFLAFLVLSIASCPIYRKVNRLSTQAKEIEQQKQILGEILTLYATRALESPKDLALCAQEMFAMNPTGACRDRFTHYLSPEDAKTKTEDYKGEFGGVGFVFEIRDGNTTIVAPLPNTPAERAGILPGDIVIKIDDKNTPRNPERVIRGKIGAKIKLTIARDGVQEPLEFILTREKISIKSVSWQVLSGNPPIGVVKLTSFNQPTALEFAKAFDEFRKKHINDVVIDLRNNPGGLMDAALSMLTMFMNPRDTILTIRERQGIVEEIGISAITKRQLVPISLVGVLRRHFRVVVLINKGSASASEIFAGTMKDWGYQVIGANSFGKGVGQAVMKLSDGSMLALTTFEFLVGNNHVAIRDKGVKPTIEVKKSPENKEDVQLDRAVKYLREGV